MTSPKFKDVLDAAVKSKRKKFSYGEKKYEISQTQKKAGGEFKTTVKKAYK